MKIWHQVHDIPFVIGKLQSTIDNIKVIYIVFQHERNLNLITVRKVINNNTCNNNRHEDSSTYLRVDMGS